MVAMYFLKSAKIIFRIRRSEQISAGLLQSRRDGDRLQCIAIFKGPYFYYFQPFRQHDTFYEPAMLHRIIDNPDNPRRQCHILNRIVRRAVHQDRFRFVIQNAIYRSINRITGLYVDPFQYADIRIVPTFFNISHKRHTGRNCDFLHATLIKCTFSDFLQTFMQSNLSQHLIHIERILPDRFDRSRNINGSKSVTMFKRIFGYGFQTVRQRNLYKFITSVESRFANSYYIISLIIM